MKLKSILFGDTAARRTATLRYVEGGCLRQRATSRVGAANVLLLF
jgi:hypothetical protein